MSEREAAREFWTGSRNSAEDAAAFAHFGWCAEHDIVYDNTRIAGAKITGERKPTEAFSELQSHYLFAAKFGHPARVTTKAMWKDWCAS